MRARRVGRCSHLGLALLVAVVTTLAPFSPSSSSSSSSSLAAAAAAAAAPVDEASNNKHLVQDEAVFAQTSSTDLAVLVTGFGPFRNITKNPSGEVALLLDGHCTQSGLLCFEGIKLPVTDAGVQVVSNYLLENGTRWDMIIHLGLEDFAKGLKFEVMALNNR